MAGRLRGASAFLLLAALSAACDAPADPEVVVETRVDGLRLDLEPVAPDPSCGPVALPACVTNHTSASLAVGPLTVTAPSDAPIEGALGARAALAPGGTRCGRVVLAPGGRVEVTADVVVPVEGRDPLRGRLRVPPCGAGPVAATVDVESRIEVTRACERRQVPACVRPLANREVEVIDARIVASAAWRIAERPGFPARATASDPVCFSLEATSPGTGTHAGRLEVEVAGLDVPLERTLRLEDPLDYHQVDTFVRLARPSEDLLFVIDDDPAVDAGTLSDNVRGWAEHARQTGDDFRVAVTTTDPAYGGRLLVGPGGGPRVLAAADPLFVDRVLERVALVRAADTPDRGLEAASAAAHRMEVRPGAHLTAVFVSPGDDTSPGTPEDHASLLSALGDALRLLQVTAVVIANDAESACTLTDGSPAAPAPRYVEMARVLGGLAESLCDPDWVEALVTMARVPFTGKGAFFLQSPAVPDSIEVRVFDAEGGLHIVPTEHWSFDVDSNAVQFNPFFRPDPDEVIEVRYRLDCGVAPW